MFLCVCQMSSETTVQTQSHPSTSIYVEIRTLISQEEEVQ